MAGPVYHMANALEIRDDNDLSPADQFLRLIQNPFKETVSPVMALFNATSLTVNVLDPTKCLLGLTRYLPRHICHAHASLFHISTIP